MFIVTTKAMYNVFLGIGFRGIGRFKRWRHTIDNQSNLDGNMSHFQVNTVPTGSPFTNMV